MAVAFNGNGAPSQGSAAGALRPGTVGLRWLTILTACLAPLAGGCQFRWGWSLLVLASAALWGRKIWSAPRIGPRADPLRNVFWGLVALHVLQLLPLPPLLQEWLAPVRTGFAREAFPDSLTAWRPLTANVEATRDNLLVLLACFAAFALGARLLWSASRVQRAGLALLAAAFGLSLYGFWVLSAQPTRKFLGVPNYDAARLSSTYTNANRFAGFLELALPLSVVSLLGYVVGGSGGSLPLGARIRQGWRSRRGGGAAVFAALCLAVLAALLLTQSRMGLAAFFVSGAGAALLFFRRRLSLGVGLALGTGLALFVLAGIGLGLDPVLKRYSLLFEGASAPIDRPLIWRHAWDVVRAHWLFGGGSGAFRSLFPFYQPPAIHGFAKFAHNDYLNALADLGVAGLALLAAGAAFWWRRIARAASSARGVPRLMLFGVAWSIGALMLHSFTDSNLQEPANAWLFCWLLGMGWSLAEPERHAEGRSRPASSFPAPWLRRLGALGVYGALLLMGLGGGAVLTAEACWPSDAEKHWRSRARQNPEAAHASACWARRADPFFKDVRLAEAKWLLTGARKPKLDEAETLANEVLALDPLEARAWYQKARAALLRGNDLPKARHWMARALRAAPARPGVALLHAEIALQAWRMEGRPGTGVPKAILKSLARALEENPRKVERALALLFMAGPWERSWQGILPRRPEPYWRYARVLAASGLRAEAVTALEAARAMLGRSQSAPLKRLKQNIETDEALVRLTLGQTGPALALLVAHLRELPEPERAARALALWSKLRAYGAPGSGQALARALVDAFPKTGWAREVAGRSAALRGAWDEARSAYRRAIQIRETAERHALLGHALQAGGRLDSALVAFEHAVALQPTEPRFRLRLAELLSLRGYFRRAMAQLDAAERLQPTLRAYCRQRRKVFVQRRAALKSPPP